MAAGTIVEKWEFPLVVSGKRVEAAAVVVVVVVVHFGIVEGALVVRDFDRQAGADYIVVKLAVAVVVVGAFGKPVVAGTPLVVGNLYFVGAVVDDNSHLEGAVDSIVVVDRRHLNASLYFSIDEVACN